MDLAAGRGNSRALKKHEVPAQVLKAEGVNTVSRRKKTYDY